MPSFAFDHEDREPSGAEQFRLARAHPEQHLPGHLQAEACNSGSNEAVQGPAVTIARAASRSCARSCTRTQCRQSSIDRTRSPVRMPAPAARRVEDARESRPRLRRTRRRAAIPRHNPAAAERRDDSRINSFAVKTCAASRCSREAASVPAPASPSGRPISAIPVTVIKLAAAAPFQARATANTARCTKGT